MKIKIMHVIYSFDIGGIETNIANLINNLDADKFAHSICVFSDKLAAMNKIPSKKIDVFIVKRMLRNDPTVLFRLAYLMARQRPDIVCTYNWGAIEGILAARFANVKVILHAEHGFGDSNEFLIRLKRRILARRVLLKFCKKVIVISEQLKRWLIDIVKIKEDKIMYLANGCDINKFRPGTEAELKIALGIKEKDVVIGSVGALKEVKGFDNLIKAFISLSSSNKDLKLVLVGDGPQRQYLMKLSEKARENIVFAGQRNDAQSFYRMFDIFILPSINENAPIALLEAMATGLPIIATDVGDVKKMLGGNEGGIIIKAKDIHGIINGVKIFLTDKELARKCGEYARNRAKTIFSIEHMVDVYQNIFLDETSKAINRNRGTRII